MMSYRGWSSPVFRRASTCPKKLGPYCGPENLHYGATRDGKVYGVKMPHFCIQAALRISSSHLLATVVWLESGYISSVWQLSTIRILSPPIDSPHCNPAPSLLRLLPPGAPHI